MQMLVLSSDSALVSALQDVSKEFAIETQHIDDHERVADHLSRVKYAGLVVDLDTVPDVRSFMASVSESRTNKTAVVFAVATKIDHIEKALEGRAHFVLRRPVQPNAIRRTLRSAYDLLSGKHRRDFRHPAKLSISLAAIPQGAPVKGLTVNISSNGVAVTMPAPLKVAEAMRIALPLPDGSVVEANGVVIWSDQHGKAGLHFQCTTAETRIKLDAWLDTQFSLMNRGIGHS